MSINDIESFIYSPPPGAINDLRYENLRSEGYYGSLNDMLYQKFRQKALNLVFDRLFINEEKGINKLDFSDFTGMYQDLARTVPYTAVEQPLGSFTGLNGVTATAPADVNRGVVSARVNLLTKTEQFDNAAWQKGSGGLGTAPVVTPNAAMSPLGDMTADSVYFTLNGGTVYADRSYLTQSFNSSIGTAYTGGVSVKANGPTDIGKKILLRHASGGGYTVITLSNEWQAVSSTETAIGATSAFLIELRGQAGGASDTCTVDIWGARAQLAIDAHLPYQRVNTATDYDTVGFPHYLAFNGTNTSYVTPSIDFTGTDKMTVWAGITKLSDAAAGILAELSPNASTNAGVFYISAPETVGASGDLKFKSRGTANAVPAPSGAVPAPVNVVVCGIGDIASDTSIIRVNGIQVGSSSADQGTGNYGNYPLFIGARAGTSVLFNGRLYSLIVRGAATPLPHIEVVETLIRQKMRLP